MYNIIISRTKTPTGYAYGIYTFEDTAKTTGTCTLMTEAQLIDALRKGNTFLNAQFVALSDGKPSVKGTTGDLKRFDTQPYVIISRLVNITDELLGYIIVSPRGKASCLRVSDCIRIAKDRTSQNKVPFQNAIYIPKEDDGKSAHIKSFPNGDFLTEVRKPTVNKFSIQQKKVGAVIPQKINLDELSSDIVSRYTKEQIYQLKLGTRSGVMIALYADPDISAEKMELMRIFMEKGYLPVVIAHPDYITKCNVDCLRFVLAVFTTGVDVRSLLNPEYNLAQLGEVHLGLISGLDVNTYADPRISALEMAKMRIAQEGKYWTVYNADERC